jgi:hypothetical protein
LARFHAMMEERDQLRPESQPPMAREPQVGAEQPPGKEEAVQCEAAKLADKVNANA